MLEVEIKNIVKLAKSSDEESNKLAIALLEQEYPDKLTYEEYLKEFQSWIYDLGMNFIDDAFHYKFIWLGYMPYLGIKVEVPSKHWRYDEKLGMIVNTQMF